ncbi:MAG: hypothetical protein ACE5I7_03585 [Candidatus Binatia bacterium]
MSVTLPPTPRVISPAVSGVILAPNGQFAAKHGWWRWPDRLALARPAYALRNVMPAMGILNVALSRVNFLDAKDGQIDTPQLLANARTEGDGFYEIVNSAAANLDDCRLMVATGGGELLTRAFVVSRRTNIDAVSEAVVRVVLDRLTRAPPVQLCDFKTEGLQNILEKAEVAAFNASGDSVAEINRDAFTRVVANRKVQQAIADATGVPVTNP